MGKYHHPKFSKSDIKELVHHCRNLSPFEKRYTQGKMTGEFMVVTQRMSGKQAIEKGHTKLRVINAEGESVWLKVHEEGIYNIPVEYVFQDPVEYHIQELVKKNVFPITSEILDEVTREYIRLADESTDLIEKLEKAEEKEDLKRETNPDNNN